jgi:hypothetical protein
MFEVENELNICIDEYNDAIYNLKADDVELKEIKKKNNADELDDTNGKAVSQEAITFLEAKARLKEVKATIQAAINDFQLTKNVSRYQSNITAYKAASKAFDIAYEAYFDAYKTDDIAYNIVKAKHKASYEIVKATKKACSKAKRAVNKAHQEFFELFKEAIISQSIRVAKYLENKVYKGDQSIIEYDKESIFEKDIFFVIMCVNEFVFPENKSLEFFLKDKIDIDAVIEKARTVAYTQFEEFTTEYNINIKKIT